MLLATALACAPTSSPRRPDPGPVAAGPEGGSRSLDDMVRSDLDDDHAFPWSAARPLAWRDFQGTPPLTGQEGAKTAYYLSSIWKCRGQVFDFRVVAAFRPRQSWVKPMVLTDSAQRRTILGHEQTHFDLAELQARRMRRALGNLQAACRKPEAELGALVDRLLEQDKVEQRRYDAETNHGLLAAEQTAWTLETRRQLAASR